MERLRPGDVSPMATTLDEYRQTHDVSPLSPVAEDERRSPANGIGRWQSFRTAEHRPTSTEPYAVSPESTRRASSAWRVSPEAQVGTTYSPESTRSVSNAWRVSPEAQPGTTYSPESTNRVNSAWRVSPDAQLRTAYSPETPTFEQDAWPKDTAFSGHQPLPVRYPTHREHGQQNRTSVHSLNSLHSLPETPIFGGGGGEKEPPRIYGRSTDLSFAAPPPRREYWDPVWLRELTLIGLACLFAVVAVVILSLYVVSSKTLGLGSYVGPVDLVYLWKFIPTAVITLLLALWNCTDFAARLLQPWANLKNGPSAAERTIFLDMITPTWPTALRSAALMGGYVPIFTIIGVILLEITRVLSTGLLQLEPVSTTDNQFQLVKTAALDASSWDPRTLDNTSVLWYNNVLVGNLTQPSWVLGNASLEPFEATTVSNLPAITKYMAVTGGFFPDLECEDASPVGEPFVLNNASYRAQMTFSSNSCTAQVELPLVESQAPQHQNQWEEKNFVGSIRTVSCATGSRSLAVITVANSDVTQIQSTAVFCQPSYFVQDIEVSVSQPQNSPSVAWASFSNQGYQLGGLDAMDLFENIVNSSLRASLPAVYQPINTTLNDNHFLRSAALSLPGSGLDGAYLEPFLNSTVLADHMKQAFTGMAALAANQRLLNPRQESMTGVMKSNQDRVKVKLGVVAPIIILLFVCLAIAIFVLFKRPRDVVPRNPQSIGGLALILRTNTELSYHFRSSLAHLQYHLQHERFFTTVPTTNDFTFAVVREGMNPAFQPAAPERNDSKWWEPRIFKTWCRVLVIFFPIGLIGALEGLQRASDESDGITSVASPDSAHYAATIIPAIVMWAVCALYSSLNFNTVLVSPYRALANGSSSGRSIFSHNLGRLPLIQLIASIKEGHIAAIFSTLAAITGPFLIIIVAALYSITSLETSSTAMVSRSDSFNTSWGGSALDDGGAGQVMSLIAWQNASYPDWTYDDLAIPQMSIGANNAQFTSSPASLTATLPARRAVLDCMVTNASDVTVGVRNDGTTQIYTNTASTCPGSNGSLLPVQISTNSSNFTGYGGRLSALAETADSAQAFGAASDSLLQNDPGCQSLIFFYGLFPSIIPNNGSDYNLSSVEAQVTTLVCQQHIQEVDVEVTLLLPNLTIDTSNPPIPDETTVRPADNGTALEFLAAYPLSTQFTPTTLDPYLTNSIQQLGGLDSFYQAIVLTTGTKPADLVGEANAARLVNATSKMYGRYMAQAMSRKMRSPSSSPQQQQDGVSISMAATVTYRQAWIVQNRGPKLALQAVLGFMALCGLAAWFSLPTAGLLPHNPGSIAGVAALMAGSELWKGVGEVKRGLVIPAGAEWMSDGEVKRQGLWGDVMFGLGWWPDGRYGIDAGGPIDGG